MDATPNASASYSWRNILAAKEFLCEGLRWQIGNGKSVRILHDRWLKGKYATMLYAYWHEREGTLSHDAKVEVLIDCENKRWNEELVSSIFLKEDAQDILKVPIIDLLTEDLPQKVVVSQLNQRTTLYILQKWKNENPSCSSEREKESRPIWKKLWTLNVASKVKLFIWRIYLNALTCYSNLAKRNINVENVCSLRRVEDGDLLHLLTVVQLRPKFGL